MARRTSTLTALGGAASVLIGLSLIGVETAVTSSLPAQPATQPSQPPLLLWLGIAFLVGNGVRDVLRWYLRTYTLTSDQLVVDEGVVTRHHRVVPIARLQQVDVTQKLIHQLFGLAELRMATAGDGGDTVVVLRLLERPRAEGLRRFLLARRAELRAGSAPAAAGRPGVARPAAPPPPPPPEVPLLSLSPAQVVLGALGGPQGALLVVLVPAMVVAALAAGLSGLAGAGGLAALLVLCLLVLATTLVGSVLSGWDLHVSAAGDDLHLRHGLLEKRAVTLPRARVQHVSVVDNPLQRALGFTSVTLHSAAGVRAQVAGAGAFVVPWVPTGEVTDTLARLLGGDWRVPPLARRRPAAHRRGVVRRAVPCGALGLAGLATGPEGVLLVVVGAALGALWGEAAHRRAGWVVTHDLAVLAHGALLHHRELVPVARVQSARTTSSPLQRRAGLATLHLDVAGGTAPHLYDLDGGTADRLVLDVPRRPGVGDPRPPAGA